MKRIYAAAGALLLGTSALAWADKPATETSTAPETASLEKTVAVADYGAVWDKAALAETSDMVWNKTDVPAKSMADKPVLAASDTSFDSSAPDPKLALASSAAGLPIAAYEGMSEAKARYWMEQDRLAAASIEGDAKIQTASYEGMSEAKADYWMEQDRLAVAVADIDGKVQTAAVDTYTGMGGPLEGGNVSESDLTPRPAAQNYPPCSPGPGDDRCIQLYEPGVRAQLASWNRPTGGLADGQATTAMGGPYEPVYAESELAMKGDGVISESETADSGVADHSDFQGVGGPVEAQSGYPPCDPGPGDDRCIQLYERGVTGAGN